MEQVGDLRHHRRQPARVEEVLHQETARRLQVDEPRRRAAEVVEQLQRQVDADATRIGDQVEDRVRRTGDRVQDADRVLERLPGEDVARLDVALDEIDDRPSRLLGEVTCGASRRPGSPRRPSA